MKPTFNKKCFGDFFSNNTLLFCIGCNKFDLCKKISVDKLPTIKLYTDWNTPSSKNIIKDIRKFLKW